MLKIKSLNKSLLGRKIFSDFSLKIKPGEIVSVMGSNGIGKTTLLNMVAGISTPDSGSISLNSKSGKIAYMMQNYNQSLLPWFKVWENISLPLKLRGVSNDSRYKKTQQLTNKYGVSLPLEKYPYELSGGQKQLTLLLQSIISQPDIILMDEPFSSLDIITTQKMQQKIVNMWQDQKPTIIYVSHRIEDSIFLANRIIILSSNPAQILFDQYNSLKYPRNQETVKEKEFKNLYHQIEKVISPI